MPEAGSAGLGLAQQRWPRLESRQVLLLVPVGSIEQHGPHLPLATDSVIAAAVTRAAAERIAAEGVDVLVTPTVDFGASGEHEGFPGTVSIGHDALFAVLTELGRSACRWARGVIFVNGHGGNVPTLSKAVELLRYEGRAVAWTACDLPDADAHAGDTETSLMRHLAPWSVRPDRMEKGPTAPLADLMPRLATEGVRSISGNGVLGDPTRSSAERGRLLFDRLVGNLVHELRTLDVAHRGRLTRAEQPDLVSRP
jgi:mycofactocin precursor peptide peptidase